MKYSIILTWFAAIQYVGAQDAPQFVADSLAAVSLDQANKIGLIADADPTSNKTAALLDAANMGRFPNGVRQLIPIIPSGLCTSLVGQAGMKAADGTQSKNGGVICSSNIIGVSPSTDKMVSTLITNPVSGSTFDASIDNVFEIKTSNLQSGFFANAAVQYFLAPQSLNNGLVHGHQHVVAQFLSQNTPLDPKKFQFFKGINQAASDPTGQLLTATIPANTFVVNGLYRFCTMSGANTHQPIIAGILRKGPTDDCVRVNVVNAKAGGEPVQAQAAVVKKSAQTALEKTVLVEKETGLVSPEAGKAALQAKAA